MNAARERHLAVLVLSLCPAAVVSSRVVDALFMSAGVVLVLVSMSLLVPLVRRIGPAGSAPVDAPPPQETGAGFAWGALLLSSCLTAIWELALNAAAPAVSSRLGIYVPLIAVSFLTMGRLDALAAIPSPRHSVFDSLRIGAAFTGMLVTVALVREILGAGSITLVSTIAIAPLFRDPARALGLGGGALICLGYAAAALRLADRPAGAGEEDESR